jgi:chemotaxis protein MotB
MAGDGSQAATVRPLRPADVVDMRRNRLQVMAERMEKDIASMPELQAVADKIQISVTDEGLEIQLLEDSLGVFFESGNAVPSMRGRQILALLGHELSGMPNPVLVAGYTDSRPYHRADGYSNWELSADRANTTRRILTINGVQDERFSQIRGFGDRDLKDPEHPFAAGNRRVTITMQYMPEDSAGPGAEDSTATGAAGPEAPPAPATAAPDPGRRT